jgi:demethylmenaquinone methyltransferase/2-methoxy-6-polyprenyl-1,4-benzoquinol methylase
MTIHSKAPNTHFGFEQVPKDEKEDRVAEVFHSVSKNYDLMNDLMSMGMHRLWKKFTIDIAKVRPNQKILDVASGTGDLAKVYAKKVGDGGLVILTDINEMMLNEGRDRLLNSGIYRNTHYVQANAECLPFKDNLFDLISISFGLRNVTDKLAALKSMYRLLKPGGKLLVLEFSKPVLPLLNTLYDKYSFKMIPMLGGWVSNDKESYQYLVESIRMHPDQNSLKNLMTEASFEDVHYHNLSVGIVALHVGYKY